VSSSDEDVFGEENDFMRVNARRVEQEVELSFKLRIHYSRALCIYIIRVIAAP
jgi:hypothetical protein